MNAGMEPTVETIVRRAAKEVKSGMVVNLGIGLPTLIPSVLPREVDVLFHSENGFIGMGPPMPEENRDHHIIDAGGQACTLVPGAACFDSVTSFSIVRGGRLDVAVLGAFEVSVEGDLANWTIPGKLTPGMGGAIELAQKANRVIVTSRHCDKRGRGKLVGRCSLPLTARRCVDTLITERAVFRRINGRLMLTSIHPKHTTQTVLDPIATPVGVVEPLEPWDCD